MNENMETVFESRRPPHVSPTLPLGAALGALAEGMADGILAVDGCGLVLTHNRRLQELWGLEAAIPVGTPLAMAMALLGERLLDCETLANAWRVTVHPSAERTEVFRLKGGRALEGRLAPARGAAPRIWSFRDVTERERALEEAAEDRRRAHADVADRERLVSVAAHELRAPLASLRIAVEALRRKTMDEARQTRLLEVIDRDERRLTRMIGELLDFGRIRSGQLRLELGPVDLAAVVHEVVARMVPEIARSGSSVTVHAERRPLIGQWDRGRLEQVVTNLIGNALKYGGGLPIDIELEEREGKRARLTVIDRGRGIEPRIHQQIFEPFARAPGVRETGLGLGLYIVHTIVEGLGGDVRVESAPGCGAAFAVELPLVPPAAGGRTPAANP